MHPNSIRVFVFLLVRRYTADLTQARDRLNRLNENLEEEVQIRTADLRRANEEIQRFAYIVSHDLRSPLVNILGFTAELEATNTTRSGRWRCSLRQCWTPPRTCPKQLASFVHRPRKWTG